MSEKLDLYLKSIKTGMEEDYKL